jgi:hypothetical protein
MRLLKSYDLLSFNMNATKPYSFQVDSELVQNIYQNRDNYLIEYSIGNPQEYCIIYFSGNDLYYPNTEQAFRERLISKDHFEWYKTRINSGYKHIFVRDIQKQFYLAGINSRLSSSQKLFSFLKDETSGFKVITVGCSAGGFASVTYGQLLGAERIYSFNGGFEIRSKLNTSTETANPIIFRNREDKDLELWFDSRNFITNPSTIYYFQSNKSAWDLNQYEHIKDFPVNRIQFINSKHGIPFLKSNLPVVLNSSEKDLQCISGSTFHPLIFSIKIVGISKTFVALSEIIKYGFKKLRRYMSTKVN